MTAGFTFTVSSEDIKVKDMKVKYKSAFISYTTDASIKARQIEGYLKPAGVCSYVFEYDLKNKGKRPAAFIRDKIELKEAFILVLSVKARDSVWVSNEVGIANGMEKKIFVYKISHNILLPEYVDDYDVVVLSKLDELDHYFG